MSQLDSNFNSLLDRCVEPSAANAWFEHRASYRDRYAVEYNSKCRTASGEIKPTTSVFTPELIADLNKQNAQNNTPPKADPPKQDPPKKDDPKKDDPPKKDDDKKADPKATCPNNMKGYVFCNHKFKSANQLKGASTTVEKDWSGCRQRCWDKGVSCRGWSWREESGSCNLFDVGQKSDMIYQKKWASGPRSNPATSQGSSGSSSSGDSSSSSTNNNPVFYYPPPDTREWWRRDDIITGVENWILIAAVLCLLLVMGGGMMMMMFMM